MGDQSIASDQRLSRAARRYGSRQVFTRFCFLRRELYYHHYDPATGKWGGASDMKSDPKTTANDLELFRVRRAQLPASSGRNVPNLPVHY